MAGLSRRFRSAITGRFVKRATAERHPDMTVSEARSRTNGVEPPPGQYVSIAANERAARSGTFRVTLAEKPRDLLIYLVDHGPASPQAIAKALDVQIGLYTGGLNVLRELGLAARDEHGGNGWHATDDGRRLVAEARDAS